MRHTIVIEAPDGVPAATVEALATRALAGAFDDAPRLGRMRVVEYHREQVTEPAEPEPPRFAVDYTDRRPSVVRPAEHFQRSPIGRGLAQLEIGQWTERYRSAGYRRITRIS